MFIHIEAVALVYLSGTIGAIFRSSEHNQANLNIGIFTQSHPISHLSSPFKKINSNDQKGNTAVLMSLTSARTSLPGLQQLL